MTNRTAIMCAYRLLDDSDLHALEHGYNHTIGDKIPVTDEELALKLAAVAQIKMERQLAKHKSGGNT